MLKKIAGAILATTLLAVGAVSAAPFPVWTDDGTYVAPLVYDSRTVVIGGYDGSAPIILSPDGSAVFASLVSAAAFSPAWYTIPAAGDVNFGGNDILNVGNVVAGSASITTINADTIVANTFSGVDIGQWSTYPAVSDVDMANFKLIDAEAMNHVSTTNTNVATGLLAANITGQSSTVLGFISSFNVVALQSSQTTYAYSATDRAFGWNVSFSPDGLTNYIALRGPDYQNSGGGQNGYRGSGIAAYDNSGNEIWFKNNSSLAGSDPSATIQIGTNLYVAYYDAAGILDRLDLTQNPPVVTASWDATGDANIGESYSLCADPARNRVFMFGSDDIFLQFDVQAGTWTTVDAVPSADTSAYILDCEWVPSEETVYVSTDRKWTFKYNSATETVTNNYASQFPSSNWTTGGITIFKDRVYVLGDGGELVSYNKDFSDWTEIQITGPYNAYHGLADDENWLVMAIARDVNWPTNQSINLIYDPISAITLVANVGSGPRDVEYNEVTGQFVSAELNGLSFIETSTLDISPTPAIYANISSLFGSPPSGDVSTIVLDTKGLDIENQKLTDGLTGQITKLTTSTTTAEMSVSQPVDPENWTASLQMKSDAINDTGGVLLKNRNVSTEGWFDMGYGDVTSTDNPIWQSKWRGDNNAGLTIKMLPTTNDGRIQLDAWQKDSGGSLANIEIRALPQNVGEVLLQAYGNGHNNHIKLDGQNDFIEIRGDIVPYFNTGQSFGSDTHYWQDIKTENTYTTNLYGRTSDPDIFVGTPLRLEGSQYVEFETNGGGISPRVYATPTGASTQAGWSGTDSVFHPFGTALTADFNIWGSTQTPWEWLIQQGTSPHDGANSMSLLGAKDGASSWTSANPSVEINMGGNTAPAGFTGRTANVRVAATDYDSTVSAQSINDVIYTNVYLHYNNDGNGPAGPNLINAPIGPGIYKNMANYASSPSEWFWNGDITEEGWSSLDSRDGIYWEFNNQVTTGVTGLAYQGYTIVFDNVPSTGNSTYFKWGGYSHSNSFGNNPWRFWYVQRGNGTENLLLLDSFSATVGTSIDIHEFDIPVPADAVCDTGAGNINCSDGEVVISIVSELSSIFPNAVHGLWTDYAYLTDGPGFGSQTIGRYAETKHSVSDTQAQWRATVADPANTTQITLIPGVITAEANTFDATGVSNFVGFPTGGSPSTWSQYPALQSVDFAGYDLLNTGVINFNPIGSATGISIAPTTNDVLFTWNGVDGASTVQNQIELGDGRTRIVSDDYTTGDRSYVYVYDEYVRLGANTLTENGNFEVSPSGFAMTSGYWPLSLNIPYVYNNGANGTPVSGALNFRDDVVIDSGYELAFWDSNEEVGSITGIDDGGLLITPGDASGSGDAVVTLDWHDRKYFDNSTYQLYGPHYYLDNSAGASTTKWGVGQLTEYIDPTGEVQLQGIETTSDYRMNMFMSSYATTTDYLAESNLQSQKAAVRVNVSSPTQSWIDMTAWSYTGGQAKAQLGVETNSTDAWIEGYTSHNVYGLNYAIKIQDNVDFKGRSFINSDVTGGIPLPGAVNFRDDVVVDAGYKSFYWYSDTLGAAGNPAVYQSGGQTGYRDASGSWVPFSGGSWVGTAESDLNMNSFSIFDTAGSAEYQLGTIGASFGHPAVSSTETGFLGHDDTGNRSLYIGNYEGGANTYYSYTQYQTDRLYNRVENVTTGDYVRSDLYKEGEWYLEAGSTGAGYTELDFQTAGESYMYLEHPSGNGNNLELDFFQAGGYNFAINGGGPNDAFLDVRIDGITNTSTQGTPVSGAVNFLDDVVIDQGYKISFFQSPSYSTQERIIDGTTSGNITISSGRGTPWGAYIDINGDDNDSQSNIIMGAKSGPAGTHQLLFTVSGGNDYFQFSGADVVVDDTYKLAFYNPTFGNVEAFNAGNNFYISRNGGTAAQADNYASYFNLGDDESDPSSYAQMFSWGETATGNNYASWKVYGSNDGGGYAYPYAELWISDGGINTQYTFAESGFDIHDNEINNINALNFSDPSSSLRTQLLQQAGAGGFFIFNHDDADVGSNASMYAVASTQDNSWYYQFNLKRGGVESRWSMDRNTTGEGRINLTNIDYYNMGSATVNNVNELHANTLFAQGDTAYTSTGQIQIGKFASRSGNTYYGIKKFETTPYNEVLALEVTDPATANTIYSYVRMFNDRVHMEAHDDTLLNKGKVSVYDNEVYIQSNDTTFGDVTLDLYRGELDLRADVGVDLRIPKLYNSSSTEGNPVVGALNFADDVVIDTLYQQGYWYSSTATALAGFRADPATGNMQYRDSSTAIWTDISSIAAGTGGYWDRTGTQLVPKTAGDGIGVAGTPIGDAYMSTTYYKDGAGDGWTFDSTSLDYYASTSVNATIGALPVTYFADTLIGIYQDDANDNGYGVGLADVVRYAPASTIKYDTGVEADAYNGVTLWHQAYGTDGISDGRANLYLYADVGGGNVFADIQGRDNTTGQFTEVRSRGNFIELSGSANAYLRILTPYIINDGSRGVPVIGAINFRDDIVLDAGYKSFYWYSDTLGSANNPAIYQSGGQTGYRDASQSWVDFDSLASMSGWSTYPAIQNVDFAGYALSNVRNINAEAGSNLILITGNVYPAVDGTYTLGESGPTGRQFKDINTDEITTLVIDAPGNPTTPVTVVADMLIDAGFQVQFFNTSTASQHPAIAQSGGQLGFYHEDAAFVPFGPSDTDQWSTYAAVSEVDMDGFGLINADSLHFSNGTAPAYSAGTVFYDGTNGALSFYNDEPDVSLQIGQEFYYRVMNSSGSTIENGQLVYFTGASGGLPTIDVAQANNITTSRIKGMATHQIENGTIGYITTGGKVNGLDTSGYTAGDVLYLSSDTAGGYTTVPPTGTGEYVVEFGQVVAVGTTNGSIAILPAGVSPIKDETYGASWNGDQVTGRSADVLHDYLVNFDSDYDGVIDVANIYVDTLHGKAASIVNTQDDILFAAGRQAQFFNTSTASQHPAIAQSGGEMGYYDEDDIFVSFASIAAAGAVDQWATYPAIQDVDFSNNDALNIGAANYSIRAMTGPAESVGSFVALRGPDTASTYDGVGLYDVNTSTNSGLAFVEVDGYAGITLGEYSSTAFNDTLGWATVHAHAHSGAGGGGIQISASEDGTAGRTTWIDVGADAPDHGIEIGGDVNARLTISIPIENTLNIQPVAPNGDVWSYTNGGHTFRMNRYTATEMYLEALDSGDYVGFAVADTTYVRTTQNLFEIVNADTDFGGGDVSNINNIAAASYAGTWTGNPITGTYIDESTMDASLLGGTIGSNQLALDIARISDLSSYLPLAGGTMAGDINMGGYAITNVGTVDGVDVSAHYTSSQNHWADTSVHFTEASISHLNIGDIGAYSHTNIDTHIDDGTVHFTEASIDHLNIQNIGAYSHTNLDAHVDDGTIHFTEASISHLNIGDIGTYSHTNIDSHIDSATIHEPVNAWSTYAATQTVDMGAFPIINVGTVDGVDVSAHYTSSQNHWGDGTIHFTEASIDHLNIQNVGAYSHTNIDTHIDDGTIHFTEASIDHLNIQNVGAYSHTNIDTHIDDGTLHFTEASISHLNIGDIGAYSHTNIDTHIDDGTLHFTEGSIDHLNIQNVGAYSHTNIDTHIDDGTLHFTEASISHLNIGDIGAYSHTNIDAHIDSTIPHIDWTNASSYVLSVDGVVDHEWSPVTYDATFGNGTEGQVRIGNAYFGQANDTVGALGTDGILFIKNQTDTTSNISVLIEGGANVPRFVIPEEGADLATYNPRSMVIGPAADYSNVITNMTCSNNFQNIDCDTGLTGADLGIQDDVEVNGILYVDTINEDTTAAGVTIDGINIASLYTSASSHWADTTLHPWEDLTTYVQTVNTRDIGATADRVPNIFTDVLDALNSVIVGSTLTVNAEDFSDLTGAGLVNTAGALTVATEVRTDEKGIQWFDPVATDDGFTIWRATGTGTVTEIECEADGGTLTLQVTNGGSQIDTISCSATWNSDTTLSNTTLVDNNVVEVNTLTIDTGTPSRVFLQVIFTEP